MQEERHYYQVTQPLSDQIMEEPLPVPFYHPPNLPKFSDEANPKLHLNEFVSQMAVYSHYPEAVKCRLFLSTLSPTAVTQIYRLPPGSITNFQQLADHFVSEFAFNIGRPKTIDDIFTRRSVQMTVREYISDILRKVRMLEVRPDFEDVLYVILTGIENGYFIDCLDVLRPQNIYELWDAVNDIVREVHPPIKFQDRCAYDPSSSSSSGSE